MTTFVQLQQRIADDLNRSDLTTQIKSAINRAIAHYAKQFRFWFNETTGTFSTVASQFNYGSADGIPTDMREIDYVKIALAASNNVPITKRTYDYVQTANVGNLTGKPTDYAYYKENFWFYPVPDQVYVITVSYAKEYTDLSLDADNNDFTNNAEDLIESRAEWWLYTRVIKDYDAAQIAKQAELEALTALLSETIRMISSNRVRPSSF